MGCLRRTVSLVLFAVLAVAVAGAWLYRERLQTAWHELRGGDTVVQPSPELADEAGIKLDELGDGSRASASLSAAELESLLLYRYPGMLPAFLDSPRVELDDDRVRLRARMPLDMLPGTDGFGEVAAFLPDTADLLVSGRLLPLDSGRVAFAVDDVSAARVPLPSRLFPGALTRLGRRDEPGLPADAFAVRLPPGVAAAYIRRDSLVLLARPRAAAPAND